MTQRYIYELHPHASFAVQYIFSLLISSLKRCYADQKKEEAPYHSLGEIPAGKEEIQQHPPPPLEHLVNLPSNVMDATKLLPIIRTSKSLLAIMYSLHPQQILTL